MLQESESSWTTKAGIDPLQEDKEKILTTAEKISINVMVVAVLSKFAKESVWLS